MSSLTLSARRQASRLLHARTIMPAHSAHDTTELSRRSLSGDVKSKNPFILGLNHSDFKKVEAGRPDFNKHSPIEITKTPDPDWKYGQGVNDLSGQNLQHVEIDPYSPERQMLSNFKLLVSGMPRPISFVSTMSKDGKRNLSPFSYFQVVDHDPPIFVIGFSGRASRPKDTRKNLAETGECVISVVSEHMIEAVNATSVDVPYGISEWELSGLQAAPSSTVKPARVKDAIYSIEAELLEMKELEYGAHTAGKPTSGLAILKATRFWVREDALNATQDEIDLSALRPLVALGGASYGRVRETFEMPRPHLQTELQNDSRSLRQFLETA